VSIEPGSHCHFRLPSNRVDKC